VTAADWLHANFQVRDVTPLKGMKLERIHFSIPIRHEGMAGLREMPNLKTVAVYHGHGDKAQTFSVISASDGTRHPRLLRELPRVVTLPDRTRLYSRPSGKRTDGGGLPA
jgi:hypothetical protein